MFHNLVTFRRTCRQNQLPALPFCRCVGKLLLAGIREDLGGGEKEGLANSNSSWIQIIILIMQVFSCVNVHLPCI